MKRKSLVLGILTMVFATFAFFESCSKSDNTTKNNNNTSPPLPAGCDTAKMSFSANMVPIFDSYCAGTNCHPNAESDWAHLNEVALNGH
jgi:hypothetical protein